MRKKKLNWKLYLITPIVLAFIVGFIYFLGEYIPNKIFSTIDHYFFDEIPYLEGLSPNKKNHVEIVQLGEGLFHPNEIKFYFKKDGKVIREQIIETAYDSQVSMSEYDFTFNWIDENQIQISIEFSYYKQIVDFNFERNEIELNTVLE